MGRGCYRGDRSLPKQWRWSVYWNHLSSPLVIYWWGSFHQWHQLRLQRLGVKHLCKKTKIPHSPILPFYNNFKALSSDRPHIHPPCMATLSLAIIREGASLPLYPFIVEVLDYFNVAPFQFSPNSIRTIGVFYIAFMEADIGKPFLHFSSSLSIHHWSVRLLQSCTFPIHT